MELFEYMNKHNHEEVAFWSDPASGLKAIIAIHDTTLGPALGGTRMWPYATEEEALLDVLRLSEGMTYKASIAGLDLGGGKAIIIGDPAKDKSEALFRAYGRFVESLRGRYITAEDVGTSTADMHIVHEETNHVTGLPATDHGSGDPSPVTAYGVYQGMKACYNALAGTDSLNGVRITIQGVGKVGYNLAKHLVEEGAQVCATDVNATWLKKVSGELGIRMVAPNEIYSADCDIFAPCALGAIINDETIPQLKAKIVAGAANNQLARNYHGDVLHREGIIYAPDYVINAGGLINVAVELGAYSAKEAWAKAGDIYNSVTRILNLSREEDIPTHIAAHRVAQARIELAKLETENTSQKTFA